MTTTTKNDVDVAPELAELHLADRPDGPGAAVMLAAGIGILVLGLLTTLNEASAGLHDFLESMQWGVGVGPLAGKTTLATAAFFASWAVLGFMWKGKDVAIRRTFWVGLVLGLVGAVLMFPPVFTAFAS